MDEGVRSCDDVWLLFEFLVHCVQSPDLSRGHLAFHANVHFLLASLEQGIKSSQGIAPGDFEAAGRVKRVKLLVPYLTLRFKQRYEGALQSVVVLIHQEIMMSDELFQQTVEIVGVRGIEALGYVSSHMRFDGGPDAIWMRKSLYGGFHIAGKNRAHGPEESPQMGSIRRHMASSRGRCIG